MTNYGWTSALQQYFDHLPGERLPVGRVLSIQGFRYYLASVNGEIETELSGKLLYGALPEELPKVGDWVRYLDYDSMGYVIDVLPRKSSLSRKTPGTKTEKQVLATNVDYALIVQGLDRDFNIMKLERYLVQVTACGIKPIVILNKADLVQDQQEFRDKVDKLQRDCPVYFCSTYSGEGISRMADAVLEKGKTYILIGSSGVGKSSILNALTNKGIQQVNAMSDTTGKGMHTTTRRDLFMLPNGSLIIDSPGMREFGVTFEDTADESAVFPAIQNLAAQCRFSDCRHIDEMECAVLEALSTGALDQTVYDSYIKLLKEQKRFQISAEDKKRSAKQFGRMIKEAKAYRKKYKY